MSIIWTSKKHYEVLTYQEGSCNFLLANIGFDVDNQKTIAVGVQSDIMPALDQKEISYSVIEFYVLEDREVIHESGSDIARALGGDNMVKFVQTLSQLILMLVEIDNLDEFAIFSEASGDGFQLASVISFLLSKEGFKVKTTDPLYGIVMWVGETSLPKDTEISEGQ